MSIQDIFNEHRSEFLEINKDKEIRSSIIDNVDNMLKCHKLAKGSSYYRCPNCNNFLLHHSLASPNFVQDVEQNIETKL